MPLILSGCASTRFVDACPLPRAVFHNDCSIASLESGIVEDCLVEVEVEQSKVMLELDERR